MHDLSYEHWHLQFAARVRAKIETLLAATSRPLTAADVVARINAAGELHVEHDLVAAICEGLVRDGVVVEKRAGFQLRRGRA